ncbi:hypothetical protein AVP41_02873 [Microbacterium sp. TNHR37B]|nr:hypothetical protein AVP41_02873 [Microbacterium sp. TNHR37B]
MLLLILFAVLAVAGAIGTVRIVWTDGYRRIPTDRTRLP